MTKSFFFFTIVSKRSAVWLRISTKGKCGLPFFIASLRSAIFNAVLLKPWAVDVANQVKNIKQN